MILVVTHEELVEYHYEDMKAEMNDIPLGFKYHSDKYFKIFNT